MNAAATLAFSSPPLTQDQRKFVTVRIGGQMFGVPVTHVQDVIRKQRITPVPLAPEIVAGALNLRGRIVTAIDMRKRLGLEPYPEPEKVMKVVVEDQNELYALIVDSVGDVLTLGASAMEKPPANMDPVWRQVAHGVFKLDKELLVVIDIGNIVAI